MRCLRCGVCCTRHQAIASLEEAQRIASYLNIAVHEWKKAYSELKWQSDNSYLIRHIKGACIFLRYDKNMSYCDIQTVKPACCNDWIPDLDKKECHEGLSRQELCKIMLNFGRNGDGN